MLDVLRQVEKELPSLLESDGWQSLDITYHAPRVQRVWREWNGFRINLHKIYPCEPHEALFHPHPWPSAVRIIGGRYHTEVGHGHPQSQPPVVTAKLFVGAGTVISMEQPWGWHSVAPCGTPSHSLMVTGKPWGVRMPLTPDIRLRSMNEEEVDEIIDYFSTWAKGPRW